jgi:hypothetical protein
VLAAGQHRYRVNLSQCLYYSGHYYPRLYELNLQFEVSLISFAAHQQTTPRRSLLEKAPLRYTGDRRGLSPCEADESLPRTAAGSPDEFPVDPNVALML